MRLGLNLGYLTSGDDPAEALALTRHAEQLGFDVVWAAEAYGSDAVTVLAWLAGQTATIGLGSAVMQVPGRTPAMTAMTAATLDVLSGGRFRLGLGVSGPQVSEGWHGVRFARPLQRTEEYLDVVASALAGQTVSYQGRHHQLPLPDGPGKALRLSLRPRREHVPIYLAAVGPRNLRLAGERADGWLAVFYAVEHAAEQLAEVAAGRRARGLELAGFDVVPTMPLVVGADPVACADPVRPHAALYVGGMGSREQNFYHALAVRMGYGAEADRIQDLYLDRQHRDAAAAVPSELIDATSLLGDRPRLTRRLAELAGSGVTTCTVTPFAAGVEARCEALTELAAAHAAL